MIQLQNVSKVYSSADSKVRALNQVNLEIKQGENVVLLGKSGSGKSTLLNIISGIDKPTQGKVIVNEMDLNLMNENQLAVWRGQNIGIVFQFYQLLPTITAMDNILFAMGLVGKIPSKDQRKKARRYMAQVGLEEKLGKFPNELSGGERQRVAIARALANEPLLIIADEPTGNLDSNTGKQIHQLFDQLNSQGTTLITVTHARINPENYHKVYHMEDGVLRQITQDKIQETA